MHFSKILLCAAAMSIGIGTTAASAAEDDMANANGCLKLADQVRSALDGNQQSANFDDARKERRYGQEYCTNGFYEKGVAHYRQALQLLGASEKTMAQKS